MTGASPPLVWLTGDPTWRSFMCGGIELWAASAIGLLAEVKEAPHCGQKACRSSTIEPQRAHGPLSLALRLEKSKLGTSGRSRLGTAPILESMEDGSTCVGATIGANATVPVPVSVTFERGALEGSNPVPQSWQNRRPVGFSLPHRTQSTLQGELVTGHPVKPLRCLSCK